jgi:Cu/Ag efflux protein CusF
MKKLILLVALLTLVAFVSGTLAQQKTAPAPAKAAGTPPPKLEKFSGVIDKVDEMAKAVVVKIKVKKEEKTLTFAIDDKTKITKGKETLSFGDLKKGMNVSVEYKKDGDKLVAVTIKAAAPKAAPKKEEPKK